MWEKLFDLIKSVLTISVKVECDEKEIAELKTEVRNLSNLVQILVSELRNVSQQREGDREFIQVWIEKEILNLNAVCLR